MSDKTKPPPEAPPSIYDKNLVRAPGPGKYQLDKYSDFAPTARGANRWSFGSKFRIKREDETPGPDKYSNPRSSFAGTRWTMAARFHTRDKEDQPAADGKVAPPAAVRSFIGQGPKFSMAGRTRPVRTDLTPDPTKYQPLAALKSVTQRVPAYSMGAKFRTIERDPYYVESDKPNPPAPAPVKSLIGQGPKYSMGGRTHRPRDPEMPGPGKYSGQQHLDLVGKSGPKFSMSARVKKGIAYGHWGDEPRLSETARLPALQVVESR